MVAIGTVIIIWEKYELTWRNDKHAINEILRLCPPKIHWEVTYHFTILILGLRARPFNGWLPLRFTWSLLAQAANLIASLWRLCRPSRKTQRDEGCTAHVVRYHGMPSLAQSNSVILSTRLKYNQIKSSDQIEWGPLDKSLSVRWTYNSL